MSTDFLSALLAANIAASAAILLVILIRKPVRQMIGARLSYWLWLVPVLAGLATLLPARDAGTVPAPAAPIQPIAEATVEFATAWTAPQTVPAQAGFDLALLIAIVWAGGVFCSLALMLLQQQRTLRTLKLAPREARVGRARAANNFGPAVVGVLKPLLVVPADFEQRFSPSEQALVLAHEDVHLAAGHTRINAVLIVLTSLTWFNPLVHLAVKLARDDQELACDATVLERFPRQRGVYAEALLKTQISHSPLPLGCTWPSRSSHFFKERLTMLANKAPSRARRMAGAGFVALALLGAGFAAWAQKPPVPSFAGASVSVDKQGRVLWEGKRLANADALAQQVTAQAASGAPHLRISADGATQYVNVGLVVRAAQKAGLKDITFMPSGVVLKTPMPPPPGNPENVPPPPISKPDAAGAKPATPKPPSDIPEPRRIFVDFDNTVYLDGKVIEMAALERQLKADVALKVRPEAHIEPHRLSAYSKVEEVLAAADRAGLTKIGVLGGV